MARHWNSLAAEMRYQFITRDAPTTLFTPRQQVSGMSVNTDLNAQLEASP